MSAIYKPIRPLLTIEHTGSKNIANCYNSSEYKITSSIKLSNETIHSLNEIGVLGYGQEFYIRGVNEPAGVDIVSCVDEDTGKKAINPYTGKNYSDAHLEYYVYFVESRVDSSG